MSDLFLSCDWGTSSFRLRLVRRADLAVLGELREGEGVRSIAAMAEGGERAAPGARAQIFEHAFRSKAEALLREHSVRPKRMPALISGMASSSAGWREVPYARLPFSLSGEAAVCEKFSLVLEEGNLEVTLISGVRAERDILRGEETELIGLYADPAWQSQAQNALVVLPGTHSKHLCIQGGALVDFRTYMTGELFDVLSAHSLLRHSVERSDGGLASPAEQGAFREGVLQAGQFGLPAALFQVRTRAVLEGASPGVNGWFLSGLLIGAELADLVSRDAPGSIILFGRAEVADAYALAWEALNPAGRVEVVPPETIAAAAVRGHACFLR